MSRCQSLKCITGIFDFLRRVIHWQAFIDACRSSNRRQQDPQISDNDMNGYLVYRAASVHSVERRRCNKVLGAIELLPPETASRCFLLHYHGMTLSRSSLKCTYDYSIDMAQSRSIDQLIAILSNGSSRERLLCRRGFTIWNRSQFRSLTYRLSI